MAKTPHYPFRLDPVLKAQAEAKAAAAGTTLSAVLNGFLRRYVARKGQVS